MFCVGCGSQLNDGVKFCPNCGQARVAAAGTPSATATSTMTQPPIQYPVQSPAQYPAQSPAPAPVVSTAPVTPPAPGQRVPAKNPTLHLIASLLIPGLGSMLNGEMGKGFGILGGYILLTVLFVVAPIFFLGMIGLWAYGMYDAYQGAKQFNTTHATSA